MYEGFVLTKYVLKLKKNFFGLSFVSLFWWIQESIELLLGYMET